MERQDNTKRKSRFDKVEFYNRLEFAQQVAFGFAAQDREGAPVNDKALDTLGWFLHELAVDYQLAAEEREAAA